MNERQKTIISRLSSHGKATVNTLAEMTGVSPATIRQDLSFLEERGFLKRYHGGATLDQTDDISHRMSVNYDVKLRIARKAATFVADGESIFIESGSVNSLLIKELTGKSNITIITSNSFIAQQVSEDFDGEVVLMGGIYQTESMSIVGNLARFCLDNVHFSKAFVGIDGYTDETGFTGRNMMRADFNQELIRKSPVTFVLTDSSKFGNIALSRYCAPGDVEYLITDEGLDEVYRRSLMERGVEVVIV